jgi:predicted kinase
MACDLECIILIGLPGAGKTTLYRQRFATTHVQVSKDLWPHAAKRGVRQRKMIEEALGAGRSVVVDNTNPTIAERLAIIQTASPYGARVIGYFFDVSTRAAVARNAARTGPEKVPNVAIFAAAKRLEPPSLQEGFDRLYRVEISKDRTLCISEISGR